MVKYIFVIATNRTKAVV